MRGLVLGLSAALVVGIGADASIAGVKSGLQVGDRAGAFNVLDVTGPSAGESLCYR